MRLDTDLYLKPFSIRGETDLYNVVGDIISVNNEPVNETNSVTFVDGPKREVRAEELWFIDQAIKKTRDTQLRNKHDAIENALQKGEKPPPMPRQEYLPIQHIMPFVFEKHEKHEKHGGRREKRTKSTRRKRKRHQRRRMSRRNN